MTHVWSNIKIIPIVYQVIGLCTWFWLFCYPLKLRAQDSSPLLVPTEWTLNAFQQKDIFKNPQGLDYVSVGKASTEPKNRPWPLELWMITSQGLYLWDVPLGKLRRYSLPLPSNQSDSKNHPQEASPSLLGQGTKIVRVGEKLYFTYGNGLYQLNLLDRHISRVNFNQTKAGRVLDIFHNGMSLAIVTSKGLFKMDSGNQKVSFYHHPMDLTAYQGSGILNAPDSFIAPLGKSLYSFRFIVKSPKLPSKTIKTKLYQSKSEILGASQSGGAYFVSTPQTLLKLDLNGKLEKSIPAGMGRKILKAHVDTVKDFYIFDDGLFEVFDHGTKKVARYALPLRETQIKKANIFGPYFIVQTSQAVRVFNLKTTSEYRSD